MNTIQIPLSKTKILFAICGSILFVVLGVFLFTKMADQQNRFNALLVKGVGVVSVLFFGTTALYAIRKMFDNKAGLIIDDEGIIDNTNATSIGLIKWADIADIKTGQVMSTRFLLIFVKNPDDILEKVSGPKRKLLAANMNMYGTPLSITATTLRYKFDDLEKLLIERLREQREKMKIS